MIHLIQKTHLPDFLNKQFITNFCFFVFAFLLTHKKYSPISVGFAIVVIFFYSYFIHIAFHNLPNIINIHINRHHNNESNKNIINKILNLLLELVTNIFFFVLFYYFQNLFQIEFVPNIIIFYYGFVYITVHNINYSIFHASEEHVIHHKTADNYEIPTCNYGPDLVDHIFNTNYSKTTFENYNHVIPNILLSFLITYYFYKPQLF